MYMGDDEGSLVGYELDVLLIVVEQGVRVLLDKFLLRNRLLLLACLHLERKVVLVFLIPDD